MPVQRVWINTSASNASFIDYTFTRGDLTLSTRMLVDAGVGIRLPKNTIRVDAVGKDMKEGRDE